MQIVSTKQALLKAITAAKDQGCSIGFVPTMGALHAGHLSLLALSKKHSSFTVMSIFVNPLQFNNPSDLEKYPRTIKKDTELARAAGVDLLFTPTVSELYTRPPEGSADVANRARIVAGGAAELLEGPSRPGHFNGVATVVGMLFNLVRPDCAIFGEKDFQQLRVIEQMVEELHFPVRIIPGATLREPDGLAMSSRNMRLSPLQRQRALEIPRALLWAQTAAQAGELNAQSVIAGVRNRLESVGNLKVDYVEVVDSRRLTQHIDITSESQLLVAAFADDIRLIDNVRLLGNRLDIS